MKNTRSSRLFWILTLLPLVISSIIFNLLPEQIPAHYGITGKVDRWGSKWEIFILPIMSIVVSASMRLWAKNLLKTPKYRDSAATLNSALIILPAVFLVLTGLFSITALKGVEQLQDFPFAKIAVAVFGLSFSLIGNSMPKMGPQIL